MTAADGASQASAESVLLEELEAVRQSGITEAELTKAKAQLRARLVFDSDSVTNIAHQLGYYETIDSWRVVASMPERIEAVTLDEVAAVAERRLTASNRTIGWFDPVS